MHHKRNTIKEEISSLNWCTRKAQLDQCTQQRMWHCRSLVIVNKLYCCRSKILALLFKIMTTTLMMCYFVQ